MRHPLLLVYETDGRLARLLRQAAEGRRRPWALREPRQPEECLELLRRGGPAVLVLKLGADLGRELALLDRASWLFPDAAVLAVGDAEHAAVAGLAWDLGARYVLVPPQPRDLLPAVAAGLLGAAAEPG